MLEGWSAQSPEVIQGEGGSLGERKTMDSSQGLDRVGAESETALGSDSLESDGLPSWQCQLGPPPTPCVNVIAARAR